jgi:hypothetical protein
MLNKADSARKIVNQNVDNKSNILIMELEIVEL